ncbi:unnamed protein product, partial [Brassica oleracea]
FSQLVSFCFSDMIERIASDVLSKLVRVRPSHDFSDFVGLEAHLEAMSSMLCLGSEEARMVGILGPSGTGNTTIARALFTQLSSQFHHRAFVAYKKTIRDNYGMKLGRDQDVFLYIACLFNGHKVNYIKNLLGESANIGLNILADKSLICITPPHRTVQMQNLLQRLGKEIVRAESIYNPGKRRFLVDAKDIADVFADNTGTENVLGIFLNTSDINEPISIGRKSFKGMRNLQFLKIYKEWLQETSEDILCLPRGLVYLPRKLRLLYWDEYPLKYIPSKFRTDCLVKLTMENSKLEKMWDGIQKLRLDGSRKLKEISNLPNAINLEKLNLSGCASLVTLPSSIQNLHKLRNLSMGECTVLQTLPNDANLGSFVYLNLKSACIENISGITDLDWCGCPMRCMPSNFHAEYLVELTMRYSKLEKLWEGIQLLKNLVYMDLSGCENLKEIPDLSEATKLQRLELNDRNLNELKVLRMSGCTRLEFLPSYVNLASLNYLNLTGCARLRSFPRISSNISRLLLGGTSIVEDEDCFFIGNISGLTELVWSDCPMRYMPSDFCAEYLVELIMPGSKLVKLWEGVQSLQYLRRMDLSRSENLKEIPNLLKATCLEYLDLNECKSLVMLPSSIRNLNKLKKLNMKGCTRLEVLPHDVNLASLCHLDLSGCSMLRSFRQISTRISLLSLDHTSIEEVPFWIEKFTELTTLTMSGCKRLINVAPNVFKLECLALVDFSECGSVKAFSDAGMVTTVEQLSQPNDASLPLKILHLGGKTVWQKLLTVCAKNCESLQILSHPFLNPMSRLEFYNCFNMDGDARELILQSDFDYAILPGREVPTYFMHRAGGSNLVISLPQSSLSQKIWGFKACIILEPPTDPKDRSVNIGVRCYVRGKSGVHHFYIDVDSCKMDHLVMFHFGFPLGEVYCPQSKLDYNHVEFEFFLHNYACSCVRFGPERYTQTCPLSLERIKGCGVRVLNLSPSPGGAASGSESEYNQQCGERCDEATERSKKRMRKAEPFCSNFLCFRFLEKFNLADSKGCGFVSLKYLKHDSLDISLLPTNEWEHNDIFSHIVAMNSMPCLKSERINTYTPAKANPVILLPFIRAAPSLTVSFFYYRDDKAKPCYSHYVYDLNAETENCDEVTQCRCVTKES